jgi:hypothetical protein
MGTVYRMASGSADGISVDMGHETGCFGGFSTVFTPIEASKGVLHYY